MSGNTRLPTIYRMYFETHRPSCVHFVYNSNVINLVEMFRIQNACDDALKMQEQTFFKSCRLRAHTLKSK